MSQGAELSESNLLEQIAARQAESVQPSGCLIAEIFSALTPPDVEGLTQAMDDPAIYNIAISSVLNDRGVKVSDSTVSRHRRKLCACYKKGTK